MGRNRRPATSGPYSSTFWKWSVNTYSQAMPTEHCSAMAALGAERLSEVEQERRGYLPFAAKSHMTDEELDEALAELEETRMTAEEELAAIRGRKEILEELERDRDALLESYAEMTPEALDALTPEKRRQVYGMLRLRVEVAADGTMEAHGILSENIRVKDKNGCLESKIALCENGLAPRRPKNPTPNASRAGRC